LPSILVPFHRTRLKALFDGWEVRVLDKVHDANPGFNREANLVQSRYFFILERDDLRFFG
jgi:hypothetical protein